VPSSGHPPAPIPHIPALDGIRGLGVATILLFHAGHLRGGWLGVDLFFVLSGFLITTLLLSEFERHGDISLGRFWARRARRLLPALLTTLLGVSLYAALFAEPAAMGRIRDDSIATLFYVANWRAIFAGHDYWNIFSIPSPLDHTWSLAIEEQFYIVWPPIVLAILRRAASATHPSRLLGWVAALLAIASATWAAYLFDPDEGTARVYFGTDTRIGATLIGAALAAALRPRTTDWPGSSSSVADGGAVAAGVFLVWAWSCWPGDAPAIYRGGLFAHGIASAALIGFSVVSPNGFASRFLSGRLLCWLGKISYGAYLWHWPIYLVMSPERLDVHGWKLTAARIAVTLAVAEASYRWVEHPIRSGRWSNRQAAAAGTVAVAVWAASLPLMTRSGLEPSPNLAGQSSAWLSPTLPRQAVCGAQSRSITSSSASRRTSISLSDSAKARLAKSRSSPG